MRYLPNLSSDETFDASKPAPWDFEAPIPERVRGDKAARHAWITKKTTKHYVYSGFEGVNPNVRVRNGRAGQEGNPVHSVNALVADFDAPMSEAELRAGVARLPYPPNYLEITLSGNSRLVWLLEAPLNLPGNSAATAFLKHAAGQLKLKQFGPGWDDKAFFDPARYYTNSCTWMELDPALRLPETLVRGWWITAAAKIQWDRPEYGITIPLDRVEAALRAKYPEFDWPSDFSLGSQGPSFWVPGSVSPKSAIIKETGIYTFSQHAAKPFFSWSDLLGSQFVEEFAAEAKALAVEGIYFDGKSFFLQNPHSKRWESWSKENLLLYLRTVRGVDARRDKATQMSALDQALMHIMITQRVAAAAPLIMQPPGLVRMLGQQYLNLATTHICRPAEQVTTWGEHGEFPWISRWLDGLFDPADQLQPVLCWLARFYRCGLEYKPEPGQALVMAGGTGIGKTLFARGFMAKLFGETADAAPVLSGEDSFNADVLGCPVWAVDDNTRTQTDADWKRFSERVKAAAANGTFRYNAKFEQASTVVWLGRIVITCNLDPESLRQIPNLSLSNRDKIVLVKCAEVSAIKLPSRPEIEAILDRELPYFAAYLRDFVVPEHLRGEARFGVVATHSQELLEAAYQATPQAAFREILVEWAGEWFRTHPEAEAWEGSATALHSAILIDPTRDAAMRPFAPNRLGMALSSLKGAGVTGLESRLRDGIRHWRIERSAFSPSTVPVPTVIPPQGKF